MQYLVDLEAQYEAVKKSFYQSVAAKKNINAARPNSALSEFNWHPNVFLPSILWREILEHPFLADLYLHGRIESNILAYFANYLVHFSWRYSKSVYKFDDYIFDCLTSSPAGRYLDHKLLTNLPEGSVYIELVKPLKLNGQIVHGVHACLNFSDNSLQSLKNKLPNQLIVIFNTHNPFSQENLMNQNPQPTLVFDISRSGKVDQQLTFIHGISYKAKEDLNEISSPFMSLISALCVDELELDNFSKGSVKQLIKTKPSWKDNEQHYWNKGDYKVNAPTNPKNWRVGVTYGVNYRQAKSAQQIEEQSKARLISLHWTHQVIDFEIRLKLMPPKLSNESIINEQIEQYITDTFKCL
ncbi:hypothetical protein [Acinetobacter sp. Marseille-Q1618]|uniref:hypothetical protein n=1 Tax=Acinetobacter sp. Marseille-Q1618 TaxID=2697502 RepID=UPI00156EADAE|nr:hypothetical protein [Acinetobacter sp. Marseille-Q1618]